MSKKWIVDKFYQIHLMFYSLYEYLIRTTFNYTILRTLRFCLLLSWKMCFILHVLVYFKPVKAYVKRNKPFTLFNTHLASEKYCIRIDNVIIRLYTNRLLCSAVYYSSNPVVVSKSFVVRPFFIRSRIP